MKNILLVGGTFNAELGKPSGLINKIYTAMCENNELHVTLENGGCVKRLHEEILPSVVNYDMVMWMPNVPNTEEKLRNVKEINPRTILIASKRNNGEYDFGQLISRALEQKANLTVEFSKVSDAMYNMRVFDPLGNVFYNGSDVQQMVAAMMNRAMELTTFTRIGCKAAEGEGPEVPDEEEFFSFARSCSDIFHNLINPSAGTTRFLGNMSFRCQNGFPSFRGKDNIIYVSRRNVDKRFINKESFVPTYLAEDGKVAYYGENKPSVDTPVQQRLYRLFPNMNYMIHAHCYFANAPFTARPVPCGAIEEVAEIVSTVAENNLKNAEFIAINLIGHGCILMTKDVGTFTELMQHKDNCFIKRPTPEYFE